MCTLIGGMSTFFKFNYFACLKFWNKTIYTQLLQFKVFNNLIWLNLLLREFITMCIQNDRLFTGVSLYFTIFRRIFRILNTQIRGIAWFDSILFKNDKEKGITHSHAFDSLSSHVIRRVLSLWPTIRPLIAPTGYTFD